MCIFPLRTRAGETVLPSPAVADAVYRIHALHCGTIRGPTKDAFTYLLDSGEPMPIPVLIFLIEEVDGDFVAVADTGMVEGGIPGRDIEDGGPGPIREALAEHGVEPGDVDVVIQTHLHHDHAANADLFPDAEFFVQADEVEFARDPLQPHAGVYFEEMVDEVLEKDHVVVDGGFRIREGLDLQLTPGHTAGQQSIFVETEAGEYAIASDLVYCAQNLSPALEAIEDADGRTIDATPTEGDYLPPGLHVDVAACYESIARVRERVGGDEYIIGGHGADVAGTSYPE